MSFSISANMRSFPLNTQRSLDGSAGPAQPQSIADQFIELARKSPLERLRDKILEDMKLSEADVANMTPEEKQAVEDEIKRRMMEALNGTSQAGQVVDKTA